MFRVVRVVQCEEEVLLQDIYSDDFVPHGRKESAFALSVHKNNNFGRVSKSANFSDYPKDSCAYITLVKKHV